MSKRILVIDDEGLITKTVGSLLKREGYEVEVCENGFQAQQKVKDSDFDLIVADIRMPGMNGVETISNIKQHLKTKNKSDIPVIFITGFADEKVNKRAEKFGEVIFKPFDMKEFFNLVNKHLKG